MDRRTLEITIQYAEDLNKVNFISKMDVYVVVSISGGDESTKQKTKTTVNHDDGANPTWSFPMKFTVEEAALQQNRLVLDFKIKCKRALGDRVIGEVHVPVKELLDFPAKGRGGSTRSFVSYQVKKPSGKPKGKLTFSYQFRGKTTTSASHPPPQAAVEGVHGESMIAYPVVDPISPGMYPPIPQQPAAAEVYAESLTAYPVVELEPSSPYLLTEPGVYPSIPPDLAVVAPPPVKEVYGETMKAAYIVLEPTPPYTPATSVVHPPIPPPAGYLPATGGLKLEWYPPPPPPPPCCVYPPQGCFGHPPPMMQLAPDWWIVDWRYDMRCSGF
ncbi:hypothetical protein C2S51_013926 [Perilla frutescens var. frutescens]|nr:hypothetical protein C2S51_013926 [Perilla frutescens var. frutescens]